MSLIILKKNLFDEILLKPAQEYDELCIVSGFATPSMAAYHLSAVSEKVNRTDISMSIIVGMVPCNKISKTHHRNFVKLASELGKKFECSYINIGFPPIHTKLYTWLKNGKPLKAFLASANYTLTGFQGGQDEVATECDPADAFDYYKSKISFSLYCTHTEAENLAVDNISMENKERQPIQESSDTEPQMVMTDSDSVKLPLFDARSDRMHTRAGLNWGQRPGREQNQAYIPIPADIARTDFFPPLKNPFSVLTEDGFPFVCVRAQPKVKDGQVGMAIETMNNNSELGEYFRRKLGLEPGAFVTLEDLDQYGNRYVTFTKINEEEYYMQFPPKQN